MGSAGQSGEASCINSWYQWSRPAFMWIWGSWAMSRRRTTTTFSMDSVPDNALSAVSFNGTTRPRRYPPSAVIRSLASASMIRSRRLSALNPPNTTEWIAPIRVHANMAMAASGIMGK